MKVQPIPHAYRLRGRKCDALHNSHAQDYELRGCVQLDTPPPPCATLAPCGAHYGFAHAVERTASVGSTGRVSAPEMLSFSRQISYRQHPTRVRSKELERYRSRFSRFRENRAHGYAGVPSRYYPPSVSVSESVLCRFR